jgi:hypothetical protein
LSVGTGVRVRPQGSKGRYVNVKIVLQRDMVAVCRVGAAEDALAVGC